jgi:hypothetical protein
MTKIKYFSHIYKLYINVYKFKENLKRITKRDV